MKQLFNDITDLSIMEKFEIILDRAKNENVALSNVADYYLTLQESYNIDIDIDDIIELAENYGYDFSNFQAYLSKLN
jgi:hypothetical protein